MTGRIKRGLAHSGVALGMAGVLGMMLVLAGCESGDSESQPGPEPLDTQAGADSPEHAVRKIVVGTAEGRGDVVASAIDQSTGEGEAFAEFMRGTADISGSLRQLQREVADKFGEEGIAVLEEQLDFDADMQPPQIEQMEIEIEGDRAVARLPEEVGIDWPLEMVRRDDDRWYVLPPSDIQAPQDFMTVVQRTLSGTEEQVQAARTAVDEANTVSELEELLGAAAGPGFPFEGPDDVPEGFGPLFRGQE